MSWVGSTQRGMGRLLSLVLTRAISKASMWPVLALVRRSRRAAAVICGGTSTTAAPAMVSVCEFQCDGHREDRGHICGGECLCCGTAVVA